MEIALNPGFALGYKEAKENTYEELKFKIDSLTLNSIKNYLTSKGIMFDTKLQTLQEFKEKIIPSLAPELQVEIKNLEKGFNENLGTVVEELNEGSTTGFQRWMDRLANFSTSVVKALAKGGAIVTLCTLAPSISATASMALVFGGAGLYEAYSNRNKTIENQKKNILDIMLFKLGGNVQDNQFQINFPEETMKTVSLNLIGEGVSGISTEDSIHFMQDLIKLDNDKKEKAVNIINNLKGNPLNVKEEMNNTSLSWSQMYEILKKDVLSPVASAVISSLVIGQLIATFFAPEAAAVAAGTLTKYGTAVIGKGNIADFFKNSFIGKIFGLDNPDGWLTSHLPTITTSIVEGLGRFGEHIPIAGAYIKEGLKKIGTAIIVGTSATAATVATLGYKALQGLYSAVTGVYNNYINSEEARIKNDELEKQVVMANMKERIYKEKINVLEEMNERSDKEILVDVIKNAIQANGIYVPSEIEKSEELKVFIKGLSNDDKNKVREVVQIFSDIREDNTKDWRTILNKCANYAYWGRNCCTCRNKLI